MTALLPVITCFNHFLYNSKAWINVIESFFCSDTHYYIGWEGTAERGVVDGRGVILEANGVDANGDPIPLGMLENADVVLRLPDGYNVSQILWVSIWCEQANVRMHH